MGQRQDRPFEHNAVKSRQHTLDRLPEPGYKLFHTPPFCLAEHVAAKQHVHHTGWWRSNKTTVRESAMKIASAKDLTVYKKAYALGMRVFEVTKRFPPEERYALTGQLRRSSRSPCRSLREAWAKRRYEAHFISKLTDADGENSETDTSLDMARDCGYITDVEHAEMTADCAEIGRMLGAMIKSPEKFLTSDR